jgi:hypothetical protein
MCGCNKAKAAAAGAATRAAPAMSRAIPRAVFSTRALAPAPAPALATLDTSVWGPQLWKALHVASNCSTAGSHLQWWGTLLKELQYGIPCPDCRAHYSAWYRTHPLTNRPASIIPLRRFVSISVGQWIHDLHNDVNRRTGKPTWSFNDSVRANGSDQLAAAKTAAAYLQGKISDKAFSTLNALLNAC